MIHRKRQPKAERPTSKADKIRFYTLTLLLILSVALAWFVNSGLSQTLSNQFAQ